MAPFVRGRALSLATRMSNTADRLHSILQSATVSLSDPSPVLRVYSAMAIGQLCKIMTVWLGKELNSPQMSEYLRGYSSSPSSCLIPLNGINVASYRPMLAPMLSTAFPMLVDFIKTLSGDSMRMGLSVASAALSVHRILSIPLANDAVTTVNVIATLFRYLWMRLPDEAQLSDDLKALLSSCIRTVQLHCICDALSRGGDIVSSCSNIMNDLTTSIVNIVYPDLVTARPSMPGLQESAIDMCIAVLQNNCCNWTDIIRTKLLPSVLCVLSSNSLIQAATELCRVIAVHDNNIVSSPGM